MAIRIMLVDDHSILSKLGVQSRTQATLYAIRTGLVSPGSAEKAE